MQPPISKNAVAAIRVSTTKQGTDSDSPEAQKEQIERYAENKGIAIKKFFLFLESASKEQQPMQEADGLWFVHRFQAANEIERRALKRQRFLFLGIISNYHAGPDFHQTTIGWQHVHHRFEQGCFPAAVGPHDADAFTIDESEIKRFKQYTLII